MKIALPKILYPLQMEVNAMCSRVVYHLCVRAVSGYGQSRENGLQGKW